MKELRVVNIDLDRNMLGPEGNKSLIASFQKLNKLINVKLSFRGNGISVQNKKKMEETLELVVDKEIKYE